MRERAILDFETNQLVRELDRLPRDLRTAFAAACAQRLLPGYLPYARRKRLDPDLLANLLAQVWNSIEHASSSPALEQDLELCMSLHPNEHYDLFGDQYAAEDAVASVAHAIASLTPERSREAALAADRAFNAAFYFVEAQLMTEGPQPSLEQELQHPIVQKELQRQRRDLDELNAAIGSQSDAPSVIAKIRQRAEREVADFL